MIELGAELIRIFISKSAGFADDVSKWIIAITGRDHIIFINEVDDVSISVLAEIMTISVRSR